MKKNNILILSAGRRVELVQAFKTELAQFFPSSRVIAVDLNPNLSGYIIAPSGVGQLKSSISFIKMIKAAHLNESKKRKLYFKIQEIFCG